MREASKEVVSSRRPRGVVALACMASLSLSAGPASAQDVFGFLRLFSSPIPQGPAYQPYDHRPFPDVSGRTSRRPKKAARADPPASKMPVRPKVPGEVINPVPELLTDSTLRRGDIVMFPDGPRVFNGQAGSKHTLADFVPVFRAGTAVSSSTRKLLASIRPDSNPAWNAEKPAGGKLVETTKNVDVTGTIAGKRRAQ